HPKPPGAGPIMPLPNQQTKERAVLLTTDLDREHWSLKEHCSLCLDQGAAVNAESQPRYIKPNRGTLIFNATVARLTKMGISVYGSRVLAVRGRTSGEWRGPPGDPPTPAGETRPAAPRRDTPRVR